MPMHLLAISVGNTRTRFAIFNEGVMENDAAVENVRYTQLTDSLRDAWQAIRDLPDAAVLMASVNAPVSERLEAFLDDEVKARLLRVERDVEIPIGRQLDPEAMVGEDRLLNAAAAYDVLQQAVVVVDAGTAVTIDFVDGVGTFHGGAIAPGASMMLTALHEHTAQLPQVTPARPPEPIGHNTVDAMRSGMYHGLRGMVKELLEKYAEFAGAYPMIVATGGDAAMLFEGDELIDRIAPHLTLLGLAITWKKMLDGEDE